MSVQAALPQFGCAAGGAGVARSPSTWVIVSNFWSGSPNANNPSNAWNVNFNDGNTNNNN